MVQIGRTDRNRLLITAFLCCIAYLATKALTGSPPVDGLYPEDPNYVDKTISASDNGASTSPEFILRTDDLFTPKIVWLMSFPNSGTSFTMITTKLVSNRSIATNYADEVTEEGKPSLPIYPFHDEGPFWPGMTEKLKVLRPLPDGYVLTKTHCGSRCSNCGPDGYLETMPEFRLKCASGHARIPETARSTKMKRTLVNYPPQRVHKAVHIIRNPFNNLVARFHLIYRGQERKEREEFLEKYPNNAEGFQNYCKDFDKKYAKEDAKAFDKEVLKLIQKVPCHGEFYKFAQWHNLAFETEESLGIPVHIIHYEDYETKFEKTIDDLMEFLELPKEGEPDEFSAGHSYDDYFSKEDRANAKKLFQKIASKETWKQVERYF